MTSHLRLSAAALTVLAATASATVGLAPAHATSAPQRAHQSRTTPARTTPARAQSRTTPARVRRATGRLPGGYRHLVVIYEENHSFDNLYGTWGPVGGRAVDGLANATRAQETQVGQDGQPYGCLPQDDVNLTAPPLSDLCQDRAHQVTAGHFGNRPFTIDDVIAPEDRTCPAPGTSAPNGVLEDSPGAEPGGCTRDIVHRFYQEQYQLDGGKQDRYTTGSDALGLTQGTYDTRRLPIWRYLHSRGAPKYTLADRFFQAAFGGSFLNHQFLVAARAPIDTSAATDGARNSVLDSNGMPTSYPQYTATGPVVDDRLTQSCADPEADDATRACGDFAVNTIQPGSAPHGSGPAMALVDDAKYPTIGDRLSAKGISWGWYSGGWDDAVAGRPGALFQYHHQPLNYFRTTAEGGPLRSHLRDEKRFIASARAGRLPAVSFVKPYGAENEHPGYASESTGSDHLVDLLETIRRGPQARSTLVVVTYDEFGGQWDHVAPPKGDAFGPGTRIPALVLGGRQRRSSVDHTTYDTTSILATIEHSYGLRPLSPRDARVRDLRAAVRVGRR
ncbi:phospholipase C [Nocardioides scoriae]|uniref:Phospholipase C n=1 Tax=Nocardioides scoriae TaxID=642780 RepID=A0A1H1L2Q2_9ACTN|nr:alkaline phosphatase family protein [Nocardioides scoriae]SDR68600.1 phospholipase C [Nocardioides scoriae]